MAEKKTAPKPEVATVDRITGARFLGGAWVAADGSLLTPQEAQQAHRAADKAAFAARMQALGGSE